MAWDIDSVATELLACEAERRDRVKFTDEWPELDVETGYKIQDETLRRRLERGETLIGVKLGLTSRAKQERMGVKTPFVAWLTDAMVLPADLPDGQEAQSVPPLSCRTLCTLKENDAAHVRFVLDAVGANRTEAARILGITLRQLQRKLAEYK